MFNLQSQLFHLHGGERFPMRERAHHDAADHDVERALARGARLFRCERCEDDILLVPAESDAAADESQGR